MVLPLVSIIIPFQIATYSLVVVMIDAESLKNIKSINSSALDELLALFDEFGSDTRYNAREKLDHFLSPNKINSAI